ncbi:MAG: HAD-IIIC family phosphatase [Coprococcus sp.]|nr:HAD-IIIC family phosphatase [Coprococcus sp.]
MSGEKIKCVVWDLDNTLWDGILAETDDVKLKSNVTEIIKELDRRGILQSISSKNEYDIAMKKLRDYKLEKYFLYSQINWNSKAESIEKIATSFNFSLDAFAFVDDQQFERDEVSFQHPEVLCIDAVCMSEILEMDRFMPKYVTEDSKNRRLLYMHDIVRNEKEKDFIGPKEDFLRTLDMKFTISRAKVEDLKRVEELTVRTHQLNSTGTIYSFDELSEMIHSDNFMVLVAQLEDVYGTYGKIGLCVIEEKEDIWDIKLLLMSCRVMSKGVGSVLMNYIAKKAKKKNKRILADFISTDRNRIMYITYRFNGFKELSNDNGKITFEADLSIDKKYPNYITVIEE